MVRFGRIPFKIAKMVLNPGRSGNETSFDDRNNKSVSEDISLDINKRPNMFKSMSTAKNITMAEDAMAFPSESEPINLKNPIVKSSALPGGLGAALSEDEMLKG